MGFYFSVLSLLVNFIVFCNSEKTLSLNGVWTVKDQDEQYSLPANVPGGIYTDLQNTGIIENIFYGRGDENSRWVPRTNWTYSTQFNVDQDFLTAEQVNIVFDGVDTFSTILINDVEIGTTQNMFVQYIFDVKNVLKAGSNNIEVRFQSPLEVAAQLSAIQNQSYPIPWHCPPDAYHGECYISMIRKMQASFSWDWGPSFPSVGLWKNVSIEAFNHTKIRYLVSDVRREFNKYNKSDRQEYWMISVDTYFANNAQNHVIGTIEYKITAVDDDREIMTETHDVDVQLNEYDEIVYSATLNFSMIVGKVSLWWPNRYGYPLPDGGVGSPTLYRLSVVFTDRQNTENSTASQRIAFKTVELRQNYYSNGSTFYLFVNTFPFFMRGANVIPISILPELGQDKTKIRQLLTSVKEANMNMIRVWGGGVYESDYFYDLADELGILVWQDFMFACSLYPANDDYLSNVVQEVRHNIKRLRSHASIVIYSGNNENEGVLANNWYGTQDNYDLYKNDYVKLYISTIKNEFDRLTHNRGIFVSSSPTNGIESEAEGYVAKNPGDPLYGDVHFYSYDKNPFDPSIYPTPRFASEYGYQSLPSKETLLTANKNISDWYGEFLNYRQHHPDGNLQNKNLINFLFKLPDESSENFMDAYIYYLQVTQALAMKVQTEHYRNHRNVYDSLGQGNTMGALYWQLNDVWVAPTWSSIDFEGRWKMLHYFAKSFFSDFTVNGEINNDELTIFCVNDETLEQDVQIQVLVYNYSSFTPAYEYQFGRRNIGLRSSMVQKLSVSDVLSEAGCGTATEAIHNCIFCLRTYSNYTLEVIHENYVLPAPLYQSKIQKPNLKISYLQKVEETNQFNVTVSADTIALFVWLDSHDVRGRFSENGFVMFNNTKNVTFESESSDLSSAELQTVLTVTNVADFI